MSRMEPLNPIALAPSGDVAAVGPTSTSLVGRGITALDGQRHAALIADAQASRYDAARAVFDRQCSNPSKTIFTDEEARKLYAAYCTLHELADVGYMRACYPVARFLRDGWRILPRSDATAVMHAADRVERIRRYVMMFALSIYQDQNLAALVAENPTDLVSVIEWCAEHYPPAIQATKRPPEYVPLSDLDISIVFETKALAWLDSTESPNDNEVLYDIGAIHRRGYAANNAERTIECHLRAADGGHATAQHNLGLMYEKGRGVEQDDTEAARWFRLSADQGNASAQYCLGVMHRNGRGVEQDDTEAVRRWRLSADRGKTSAQHNLGVMYVCGSGVEQDDTEAVRWFRLSADQGDASAQYCLGVMHRNGRGVERDDTEAIRWFRLSAGQCNALAQFALGWMYESGRGVDEDKAEAVRWYRLSADQGCKAAQERLGSSYKYAHGVQQDAVKDVR